MNTFKVTDRAQKQLAILATDMENTCGFRLSVKAAGCSGYRYVFEPIEQAENDDQLFPFDTFNLFVNNMSLLYLNGTEIDFVTTGVNSVFEFNNPNASAQCGCGESFMLAE